MSSLEIPELSSFLANRDFSNKREIGAGSIFLSLRNDMVDVFQWLDDSTDRDAQFTRDLWRVDAHRR